MRSSPARGADRLSTRSADTFRKPSSHRGAPASGELGLADQLPLGPLAQGNVLDHRHDEGGPALGVALEHGSVLPTAPRRRCGGAQLRLVTARPPIRSSNSSALRSMSSGWVYSRTRWQRARRGCAPASPRSPRCLRRAAVGAEHPDPDRRALEHARKRLTASNSPAWLIAAESTTDSISIVSREVSVSRAVSERPITWRAEATRRTAAHQRRVAHDRLHLAVDARIGRAILDQQRGRGKSHAHRSRRKARGHRRARRQPSSRAAALRKMSLPGQAQHGT